MPVAYSAPIYGLFELPQLIGENEALGERLEQTHLIPAIVIVLSIVGHVVAAPRHHFLLRDDTLRGILPGSQRKEPVR